MKKLKITIEPLSSFITPIQSDTLFGQFAWTYMELYGEEKLKKDLLSQNPAIVFSDAFPEEHIPYPVLKPVKEKKIREIFKDKNIKEVSAIKKRLKKRSYISLDIIESLADNLSGAALIEKIVKKENDKEESFYAKEQTYKNSIRRDTGTTGKGGGLYGFLETFYLKEDDKKEIEKTKLDIYIVYNKPLEEKKILEVLEVIGINGFGKEKSTGKGKFNICQDKIKRDGDIKGLNPKDGSDHIISLSTGALCENLSVNYAKAFTKFPKHGGSLAAQGKYIKNPIMLYRAGSTFTINEKKDVYGSILKPFSNENPEHIHNAHIIPYFVKLEDSEEGNE